MQTPIIGTERLILRGWTEADVEPYARMLADPETARFIVPGGEPVKPRQAWEHSAVMAGHWALHGHGMFVVADRTGGAFLGRVGVWSPPGWFGLEVGWAIIPEARGRGLALEATVAAMRWTFENSGSDSIIHCIDAQNIPSQRLAVRLGARERRPIRLWGRPAAVWETRRGAFASRHG